MRQYLDLLKVLMAQEPREDRTGTGTRGVFGPQMSFDLCQGFPIMTTKSVSMRIVATELLWMLSGSTNNKDLNEQGVHIWDEWAGPDGSLGPIYGEQWRRWPRYNEQPHGVYRKGATDQIAEVLASLRKRPFSRRHVVSAWHPTHLPDEAISPHENVKKGRMCLAPCHCLFQFYVRASTLEEKSWWHRDHGTPTPSQEHSIAPSRSLDCKLYQRSADFFLGVPYNIASYALLTHLFAEQLCMLPGTFIWSGGDTHLYLNHMDAARTQLEREPLELPRLVISPRADLFDYKTEDISLSGYAPWPVIQAPISV